MTRRQPKSRKNTKKRRPSKKRVRKTRAHTIRGGACYGTGVGITSTENNFSVFNTSQLKLFPYKP